MPKYVPIPLARSVSEGYSYDRNGNLLSDGQTSYTYNASDKTVGGKLSDGTQLSFGYDGEGNRVSRTVGA